MAAVAVQQSLVQDSSSSRPHPSSLTLDSTKFRSAPLPNKHITYCPPGPAPCVWHRALVTPPASQPSGGSSLPKFSVLQSVDSFPKVKDDPPVYSIDAAILAAALDGLAAQALPDPKQVFPWLHGLHPDNQAQLAFFIGQRKASKETPKCLRGITVVKANSDLTKAKLKGALGSEELLCVKDGKDPVFVESDPRLGFTVRNFHIQAAKMARLSDIVVYGTEGPEDPQVRLIAERFAVAQQAWAKQNTRKETQAPKFNTFVISSSFEDIENNWPHLVAVDSHGRVTGKVIDFSQREREEMCSMSKASEISRNVWLGPTPSHSSGKDDDSSFDIFIETNDLAQPLCLRALNRIGELSYSAPQHLEFPSSGSIMPSTTSVVNVDPLAEMCSWIYQLANPSITPDTSEDEGDEDGDIPMKKMFSNARKVLIHCTDGYTESTLLGLAYFMYAEAVPMHEAWLRLHCEKNRNFFAYPSDVTLLASLKPWLLRASKKPMAPGPIAFRKEPPWLSRMDGSLPSRILPYMYLGNLGHANNPSLLSAMGIKKILSVGEPLAWSKAEIEKWGAKNMLSIARVQDNGVDPLMNQFDQCLQFIRRGIPDGTATLVHCRVGVSRSATICIAEVMASLGISFPQAYCFVRARRLNVIIQPHLRFVYELLKWDELQQQKRGEPIRRELEWATVAKEIAAMNKPYSR